MTNKQLIKKLEQAYQVCRDCGFKYGVYSVGCSSSWEGTCDVCDETKGVTEARDYGYLITGIRKLKLEGKDPAPKPKVGDTWLRSDGTGLHTYDGTEWVAFNKETIKQQSKEVAEYMFTQTQESEFDGRSYGPTEIGSSHECKSTLAQEPIMTDEDLDKVMNPSYLKGKIQCWFTEYEVAFLNECLDTIQESHPSLSPAFADPDEVALFESVEEKITELYQDHCVKYELSPAMKAYHAKYNTFGFENELDTARWEGFRDAFVMKIGEDTIERYDRALKELAK
jgi:hypothetical protein